MPRSIIRMYSQYARHLSCIPRLPLRHSSLPSPAPALLPRAPWVSPVSRISRFSSSAPSSSSGAPQADVPPAVIGRPDPKSFDIGDAIDGMFLYEHGDAPLFPEYMRKELKPRVIANVRSKVNLLRAQGVKVPKAKMDEILVEEMLREGAALARTEEDRVNLLVSEAPKIGDKHQVEGKPATVVRRFLVTEDVMQLVVESEVAPPSDQMVRQFYTVHDSDKPIPEMDDEEKQRRVEFITKQHLDSIEASKRSRADRIAVSDHDMDRALHEKLLGKEHPDPETQTPEERAKTREELEQGMMAQLVQEDEEAMKQKGGAPDESLNDLKLEDLVKPGEVPRK